MKILRLITRMNVGGPARQVSFLQKHFCEQGHDSTLVYGQLDEGEGDMSTLLEGLEGVVQLPELVRPISPWRDLRTMFRVLQMLSMEPYEWLHTHTAKAGMVGRMAALLSVPIRFFKGYPRLKCVHTYHGHVFSGYFSPMKTKLIKGVERFLFVFTDQVLALTPAQAQEIAQHLGVSATKMKVVPLGLELAPYLTNGRGRDFQAFLKNKEAPVVPHHWVGWVGRFASIKNPLRFINLAVAIVKKTGAKIGFVMVGDGPLRVECEAAVQQMGLADQFVFLGWRDDLCPIYENLSAFVNSSDNEGTPVAVLEAMASGLPVLATDVGGTREIMIGDEGAPLRCFPVKGQGDDGFSDVDVDWLCEVVLTEQKLDLHLRKKTVADYSQQRLVQNLEDMYGLGASESGDV
jgi:glycosyltransferase involved in cell wall biosynthesis